MEQKKDGKQCSIFFQLQSGTIFSLRANEVTASFQYSVIIGSFVFVLFQ